MIQTIKAVKFSIVFMYDNYFHFLGNFEQHGSLAVPYFLLTYVSLQFLDVFCFIKKLESFLIVGGKYCLIQIDVQGQQRTVYQETWSVYPYFNLQDMIYAKFSFTVQIVEGLLMRDATLEPSSNLLSLPTNDAKAVSVL